MNTLLENKKMYEDFKLRTDLDEYDIQNIEITEKMLALNRDDIYSIVYSDEFLNFIKTSIQNRQIYDFVDKMK